MRNVKLRQIQESVNAWQSVSGLKKNPKLAYRLLKYEKKVERELDVIDKQRTALVYECAGEEPPTPPDVKVVTLEAGSDAVKQFTKKFDEFLDGESDLELVGITMQELIDGLAEKDGNAISEADIDALDPFFTPPTAAET